MNRFTETFPIPVRALIAFLVLLFLAQGRSSAQMCPSGTITIVRPTGGTQNLSGTVRIDLQTFPAFLWQWSGASVTVNDQAGYEHAIPGLTYIDNLHGYVNWDTSSAVNGPVTLKFGIVLDNGSYCPYEVSETV